MEDTTPDFTPDTPQPNPVAEAFAAAARGEAPAEPAPTPAVSAPAVSETVAVEPGTAEPVAETAPVVAPVDYAAWLKEQVGVEDVTVLKSQLQLAQEAEAFKANQRDAQDVALRQWVADKPAEAAAYFQLQAQDFAKLAEDDPREVMLQAFQARNPAMPADIALDEFVLEFARKFPNLSFEDADNPDFQRDQRRLGFAAQQDAAYMQEQQQAAKIAALPQAAPPTEGPSAEDQQKNIDAHLQAVDAYFAQPAEIEFSIDGAAVKVGVENTPATKAFMDDYVGGLQAFLFPDGQQLSLDRVAALAAFATDPDGFAKHLYTAGKSAVGPSVPMGQLVNSAPAASASAAGGPTNSAAVAEAFRQLQERGTH
ncbi:hypothetical protein [Hymenobacter koreensis]|uniref:Uncharacterized protein n=1 Tax=Hymenobacter koreensis TaxID=1084523 RepID=A0ABP8JJT9_9BACT